MKALWLLAAFAMLPPLAASVLAVGRRSLPFRVAALQLATTLTILVLLMLSFAFDQASSIDLGLALAVLSLPASLVVGLFVERWL